MRLSPGSFSSRRVEDGLDQLPLGETVAVMLYGTQHFSIEDIALSMDIPAEEATRLVLGGFERLREKVTGLPGHEHSTVARALGVAGNPSTTQSFADR